jgi:hypothetical protein
MYNHAVIQQTVICEVKKILIKQTIPRDVQNGNEYINFMVLKHLVQRDTRSEGT